MCATRVYRYSPCTSVSWITDLSRDFDVKKSDPREIVRRTLDALEKGREEVLADPQTEALKRSLSTEQPYYLNPPNL
jgi:hypothetical protein